MRVRYTRQANKWFTRHRVNTSVLTACIKHLCKQAGGSNRTIAVHIMPQAVNSDYQYYLDKLNVAVESARNRPRYFKLQRVCRNLLHELRHFIQYRIQRKPFAFTYSYRDMTLLNSKYWNDPDEIDARKYEKSKFNYLYRKLI